MGFVVAFGRYYEPVNQKEDINNTISHREHLSFVKSIFFIVVRASPLAYCTIRERGRSHCKCKTEMLPFHQRSSAFICG